MVIPVSENSMHSEFRRLEGEEICVPLARSLQGDVDNSEDPWLCRLYMDCEESTDEGVLHLV